VNREPAVTVVELAAEETHDLRRRVLRVGTPTSEVVWEDDALDGTLHLGVIDRTDPAGARRVLAISTWIERAHPDRPARRGVQLRGMATDPAWAGRGLGALLLRTGIARQRAAGVELVWARARDTALDFYLRHGFEVFGRGYVDLTTALAHHDVIAEIADPAEPGTIGGPGGDGGTEVGPAFPSG
jgi:GNAT superfamily N-acetyltransferase